MKQTKSVLDVDAIGGQKPLTTEEAKEITKFIKFQKEKQLRSKRRSLIRKKITTS